MTLGVLITPCLLLILQDTLDHALARIEGAHVILLAITRRAMVTVDAAAARAFIPHAAVVRLATKLVTMPQFTDQPALVNARLVPVAEAILLAHGGEGVGLALAVAFARVGEVFTEVIRVAILGA